MSKFDEIALKIFGGFFKKRPLISTKRLLSARIYMPVVGWQCRIALYSLLLSPLLLGLWIVGFKFLFNHILIWDALQRFSSFSIFDLLYLVSEILLALALLLLSFFILFFLSMLYPFIKAWDRGRKIEAHLPHSIGWMSSMASIGVPPYMIFKKLSEAEEFYGEVSIEAKQIVRDVEVLGFDFISALRNLASITPSTRLRIFLQGMVTSSLSGGEMGNYFISKARENMEENRKRLSDFIETLKTMSEVYMTGLVAGPLLILIMLITLMMMKGASPMTLKLVVYAVIPVSSILFLVLLDLLTPLGMKK